MSINLKNAEAERLVAEIKVRTGRGTTDLLLHLLRQEAARLRAGDEDSLRRGRESARRLQDAWRAGPVLDDRPIDQLIPYDENGLPC